MMTTWAIGKILRVCIFRGMAGLIAHLQPCLKVACSTALLAPCGISPACEPALSARMMQIGDKSFVGIAKLSTLPVSDLCHLLAIGSRRRHAVRCNTRLDFGQTVRVFARAGKLHSSQTAACLVYHEAFQPENTTERLNSPMRNSGEK